jgi:hypothetical protein
MKTMFHVEIETKDTHVHGQSVVEVRAVAFKLEHHPDPRHVLILEEIWHRAPEAPMACVDRDFRRPLQARIESAAARCLRGAVARVGKGRPATGFAETLHSLELLKAPSARVMPDPMDPMNPLEPLGANIVIEYSAALPRPLRDHLSAWIGARHRASKRDQRTMKAMGAELTGELRRLYDAGQLYHDPDNGWTWELGLEGG